MRLLYDNIENNESEDPKNAACVGALRLVLAFLPEKEKFER